MKSYDLLALGCSIAHLQRCSVDIQFGFYDPTVITPSAAASLSRARRTNGFRVFQQFDNVAVCLFRINEKKN